jgi:hypothetical protein
MNCFDGNHCFDIGTHVEAFGVLGNSTVVLATQMQKLCWSMLEINDCYNPPLMIIQLWGYRGREAPPFYGGEQSLFELSLVEKIISFIV